MTVPRVRPVPDNTLIAYAIPGSPQGTEQLIRPCEVTREWMDSTPERYAYRCVPLTAANSMGWELLNPIDAEITWTGKDHGDQLHFKVAARHPFAPVPHFGGGTITWYLPFLFRTPSDYGLLITGPGNHDKQHVTPLDAFVRSDWLPFPFTMNWRITTPQQKVFFAAGEPICRIIPYPLTLLNQMTLEIHDMEDDPVFMQRVSAWHQQRQHNYTKQQEAAQQWQQQGRKPALTELWNTQYAKGEGAEDALVKHQNIFKCAAVIDKRKGTPSNS